MNSASEVLIIGGGAVGLAIAVELKLRGASVTLLSRDFKQAASHAAAGMLAPRAEHLDGPMLDLCLQSRALYPDWTQKLEDLTGQSTGYWPCGILSLELGDEGQGLGSREQGSGVRGWGLGVGEQPSPSPPLPLSPPSTRPLPQRPGYPPGPTRTGRSRRGRLVVCRRWAGG